TRVMSSAPERRALVLIAGVAALGVAARAWRATHEQPQPAPAEVRALDAQLGRIDSARRVGRGAKAPRRTSPARASRASTVRPAGEAKPGSVREPGRKSTASAARAPVDLDRANAAEIEALPWIGPALAARIVANRDKCGPFGDLKALTRV